jgi:hypothetical protein
MTTRSIDLSGIYTISALTATEMDFVSPTAINANWNYANLDGAGTTGYSQNITLVLASPAALDLSGTYTVASVTASSITLVDAAGVNSNWSSIGGLFGGLITSLTSASFAKTNQDNWQGPFTVGLPDASILVVNFVASGGLYKDDGKKQTAFPVTIQLEVTPINSEDVAIGAAVLFEKVVPGNSSGRDLRAATLVADLPFAGRCRVRARRLTPTDLNFKGTVVDEVKIEELFALSSTDLPDFGDVTTVHVRNYATAGATSVKERKLNCHATRKVLVRNEDDTFGPALAPSRNMADILCHIALDPYLGNRTVSELDVPQIYATAAEIAAYFGFPEAAEFNYTFDQDNVSFEEIAQTVAQTCFASAYRQGSKLRLFFEQRTEDSTLLFNHRNKIPGSESRTVRFGRADDHDGVELVYTDINDGAKLTLYLPADRSAVKPKKIELPGVTDERVAYVQAYRAWNKIRYQNTAVEFSALPEASQLVLGERIEVTDNTRPDVYDGYIVSVSGLVLELSQPFEAAPATNYVIYVQQQEGTIDVLPVVSGEDEWHVVLQAPPTVPIVVDSEASADVVYQITAADPVAPSSAFLLTEKGPYDKKSVQVQAINYDSRYYDNDQDRVSFIITTEAGDRITTEAGDLLIIG